METLPSDPHARTLALLRFELHSRKAALRQVADIQARSRAVAGQREDSLAFLHSLPAQLAAVKAAVSPLGQQLGAPMPASPAAPASLSQQPLALRNIFLALHAMQGSTLPSLALHAATASVSSVQVCASDADLTAVPAAHVPAAYAALLQQLQRESRSRQEATGPVAKLLRLGGSDKAGGGDARLPGDTQSIFKAHPYCVHATVDCADPVSDGAGMPLHAHVSLQFLWLPHLACVFVAATANAKPCSLQHLFPGDSGAVLPTVGAERAAVGGGRAMAGLPVPPACAARPFLWAQAMAGMAVQGLAGVWVATDGDDAAAAAGACISPTARSVVAAVTARALQGAHTAAAVDALQACCNGIGSQGIIPASPAAQAAVRRLRTATQALLSASASPEQRLPASARLESVRQLPEEHLTGELRAAVHVALLGAKRDFQSELAALLQSRTAWGGSAAAKASRAQGASADTGLEAAMTDDEWVVTEDDSVGDLPSTAADTDEETGTAPPPISNTTKAAGAHIVQCVLVLPSALRVQVLLICGPRFPAHSPVVLLLALGPHNARGELLAQHDPSSSIQQRLALDDLGFEMNHSMQSIVGNVGVSIQDILRLLQSAAPLAETAALQSVGPGAASSAWRSLLQGRARRLRLLSLAHEEGCL